MSTAHDTYEEFLAGDRRRHGDALELGHDVRDAGGRWRVCWYEGTGELTMERLSRDAEIVVDDFHAGVAGPVRVLDVIASQRRLESVFGRWPAVERWRPRTLDRLRELVDAS